jgi:hypothetical protein
MEPIPHEADLHYCGRAKSGNNLALLSALPASANQAGEKKELHYFDNNYFRDQSWYESMFPLA